MEGDAVHCFGSEEGVCSEKGANVAYDAPHADMNPLHGHDKPDVGLSSRGKQPSGGHRGNITYDGPQHPSRPDKK
jgi:hypothetical protein